MDYKLRIKCKNCQTNLVVPVKEDMFGKSISIRCKKCNEIIPLKIPKEEVFKKKQNQQSSQQNSGTQTVINTITTTEIYIELHAVPNGNTRLQKFDVDQARMTIGRKNMAGPRYRPDLEVDTEDKYMSKVHAVFSRKGKNAFTIADLNSTNGTWLNGEKLHPNDEEYLENGDLLKIGRTEFSVKLVSN